MPNKSQAYGAWGGEEVNKRDIEVLAGHHYPLDSRRAVSYGQTRLGEPLYVGRGYHANSLTPGKVHLSHGCLYIG
nr:uncharacterized protein LOC106622361 [Bactrocera oleae]